MEGYNQIDIKWRKKKSNSSDFYCVESEEVCYIVAFRENVDAPFEVSCLESDNDNSKILVAKLNQIKLVEICSSKVRVEYTSNNDKHRVKIFKL